MLEDLLTVATNFFIIPIQKMVYTNSRHIILFSLVVFFIKTFLHQIQCLFFFTTKFYISFFLSLYFICPIYFAVCVWGDRCWRWSHVPFTAENIKSPGRKWKHYNRIHHNTGTINWSKHYNRIHYNTGTNNWSIHYNKIHYNTGTINWSIPRIYNLLSIVSIKYSCYFMLIPWCCF